MLTKRSPVFGALLFSVLSTGCAVDQPQRLAGNGVDTGALYDSMMNLNSGLRNATLTVLSQTSFSTLFQKLVGAAVAKSVQVDGASFEVSASSSKMHDLDLRYGTLGQYLTATAAHPEALTSAEFSVGLPALMAGRTLPPAQTAAIIANLSVYRALKVMAAVPESGAALGLLGSCFSSTGVKSTQTSASESLLPADTADLVTELGDWMSDTSGSPTKSKKTQAGGDIYPEGLEGDEFVYAHGTGPYAFVSRTGVDTNGNCLFTASLGKSSFDTHTEQVTGTAAQILAAVEARGLDSAE